MSESTPQVQASSRSEHRRLWAALLIVLSIGFAIHALAASRDKSPTYDEPVHAFSSWLIVNEGDFRVNPEHPALWKYVAGLPLIGQPLTADLTGKEGQDVLSAAVLEWPFTATTLYGPASLPNDALTMITRARIAMSVFSLALALVVARWAWVWGGPIAALLATLLLTLDPNMLGHAGLVTNDIAATMLFTLATFLTWRLGERVTPRAAIKLMIVCAAAIGTKFSCLLLGPMVGLPLLYRSLDRNWPWFGGTSERSARTIGKRVGFVIGLGVATGLASWLALWPVYQFRTAPTPGGERFDDRHSRIERGENLVILRQRDEANPKLLSADELARAGLKEPAGAFAELLFQITERGLVPQAWGYGLSFANTYSMIRGSFLMGEYSYYGFVTYFPLAMLFKTPTATLALVLVCFITSLSYAARRIGDPSARWKLVCLFVPPAIYLAFALASNLNIGMRHVLPLYPPMYVAASVVMARALRRWWPARVLVPAVIVGLAVETVAAFPNYIAFFNAPCGGTPAGLTLLGDSNLDWGQDLPALARWYKEWRRENPTGPFYLSYFGTVPPSLYGIDYIDAVPGFDFDMQAATADFKGGVIAVSATHLQAIYWPQFRHMMAEFREQRPLAVINGTIYIYRLPTRPPSATTMPASTTTSMKTSTTTSTSADSRPTH